MDIVFKISDSKYKTDNLDDLHKKIVEEYTKDGFSAEVTIDGDIVHIHFTEEDFVKAQKELQKIRDLCDQQKFTDAENLLDVFLKRHPFNSEAYRIKAQLVRQQGNPTRALDICLEALRCDPKIFGL